LCKIFMYHVKTENLNSQSYILKTSTRPITLDSHKGATLLMAYILVFLIDINFLFYTFNGHLFFIRFSV